MEDNIKQVLDRIKILTKEIPPNKNEISQTLKNLQEQNSPLEDSNYELFCYVKYIIAETKLSHLNLTEREINTNKSILKSFKEDYDKLKGEFTESLDNNQTLNDKDDTFIIKNNKINQEDLQYQNERLYDYMKRNKVKFLQERVLLIIGDTGVGKSSFVQKLTGDQKAVIGHTEQSETQQCNLFVKNGYQYIDTPGISDTKKSYEEIFLTIAKYLHVKKYKLSDIFTIYVQNGNLKKKNNNLAMLSYAYFLYEIFDGKIKPDELKKFFGEYVQSMSLLNWSECSFHNLNDGLSFKRALIFTNRDRASDYYQQFDIFHIVVKTKFDRKFKKEFETFDQYKMDFLREQIWSNKQDENTDLIAYKEYIQKQEEHLFEKIQNIIDIEIQNQIWNDKQSVQNILLIGKSQVGKSSLIEQLTQLKGLRGSGEQSMTQTCQMFPVTNEKVRYRFIDTPGHNGTERNQSPFHNLKIIADFLRRNKINEFKILYLVNADTDVRDDLEQVLKQLFIFIQYMFDQDSSFVDNDFLNDLNSYQSQQNIGQLQQMRNKIVKINRISLENFDPIIDNEKNQIINVKFFTNFFTDQRFFIQVDQLLDKLQQDSLFKAIDLIEPISIEDKIQYRIQGQQQIEIIENQQQYEKAYIKMNQKYVYLNELQLKIFNAKQQKDEVLLEIFLKNKVIAIKDIKSFTFIMVGQINLIKDQAEYSKLIKSSQQLEESQSTKLLNDIYKHFITPKFQPVLFETTTTSKYVLFSRIQKFYSILYHQLGHLIKNDKKEHIEILENLAKTKLIQEITLQSYLQQKIIELNYDKNNKLVIEWVEVFSQGINTIFGTGAQLYRYSTYFSYIGEASSQAAYAAAQKINVVSLWLNVVLVSLSVGIDIYQKSQGFIGSSQFQRNTRYNIASAIISVVGYMIPGYGWAVGGIAGAVALYGYITSSLLYTSKEKFDNTIGMFFKQIIDDQHPNQQLLYFQKSDFLKSKYNISNYSNLKQKEGYEMFRELEQHKLDKKEQKITLQKLFGFINPDIQILKNSIARQIALNIISQELKQENYNQDLLRYLPLIYKQIKDNQQIIDSFYNNMKCQQLTDLKDSLQNVEELLKKKLKILKRLNNTNDNNNLIELQENEKELIQKNNNKLISFKKFIEENIYTFEEQVNFGNGNLRKNDNFLILFNSYCNLMQQKTSYLFDQQKQLIKELKKNENDRCLMLNSFEINMGDFLKQVQSNKQSLTLLTTSEYYSSSRYLQKIKNEDPNLTYLSEKEIIDGVLDYSIDLHQLVKNSSKFEEFVDKIKVYNKDKNIDLSYDLLQRLNVFYKSYNILKETFQ